MASPAGEPATRPSAEGTETEAAVGGSYQRIQSTNVSGESDIAPATMLSITICQEARRSDRSAGARRQLPRQLGRLCGPAIIPRDATWNLRKVGHSIVRIVSIVGAPVIPARRPTMLTILTINLGDILLEHDFSCSAATGSRKVDGDASPPQV